MSQTFSYKLLERLEWTFLAAGAGIVLLLLGVGLPTFAPQESISTTRWLEVLTGSATGQPTFYTPLSRVIFVVFGIITLIFAVIIYRITSVTIKTDDEAITYQRTGGQTVRVTWSEVTDVKKRVIAWRYGSGDIFTIATETDPHKITFKSTINGFPDLLEAIKTHTKIEFSSFF
ncbi:MAG: hypothetical protein KAI34_01930 [Candidatus Lokiarchaeota archaeon]|nr:hypothetical protein [Candidatus Lokiarchaeota archaeon]